ncbi:uncharacterized protein J3D65DRAFT_678825 [Phyllosticta citribraziliensis]|uniref:Uncharacterized protein n=1 Tax=Phyllosticta citribraziliensis TaxID=989973 RepID=A0ABR1LJB4_9PEZI
MGALESFSPVHAEMTALEREASKQIQAILQFQAVLQSANRLLWPDMFQAELVRAARLLHFDLRPKLQRKATVEIADKFECYADILVKILASWHRRNRLLAIKLGLTIDDIPMTARIGEEERREIFEAKAKTLPTLEGCEVNLLTALAFQSCFAACIAFKTAAKQRAPSSPAEKQMIDCLASIRDHVNNVTLSAEHLRNDAAAPWSRLSQTQASNASSVTLSTVVESRGGLAKSKSTQALRKVKRMFSRASLKTSEHDLPRKESSSNLRVKKMFSMASLRASEHDLPRTESSSNLRDTFKRMSRFASQVSLSIDPRKPSSSPVQSGLVQGLSALPPASLVELEKKQVDVRVAFLRASDNGQRGDGRVEVSGFGQERQYFSTKGSCGSVAGIDGEDFAALPAHPWQKERDDRPSTPAPQPTDHSHSHRHGAVYHNHSTTFTPSSNDNLPAHARNIPEIHVTAPPPRSSLIADPETQTVWWRDQAFGALEGRSSSHAEEQEAQQTAEGEQEEEKGADSTAEESDAWKTEARALALSVLEGTGPYDTGSHVG